MLVFKCPLLQVESDSRHHHVPVVFKLDNLLFSISSMPVSTQLFVFRLRTLRLIARNNKLYEIKNLMQESVGHGAPSPKLVKLEAIILQHFR